MQVYGLRLVGLVQASQPFSNGSLGGSQRVAPEQLREVVCAAASSALQCVVFDGAVLGSRQGTGAVACCRQSGHCRALHEGVIVEVTSVLPLEVKDVPEMHGFSGFEPNVILLVRPQGQGQGSTASRNRLFISNERASGSAR